MAPTRGAAAMVCRACILLCAFCYTISAEDVSVVTYNIRHFQGLTPALQPDWSRWADTEWYPDPSKPGFYDFYAGLFESLNGDIIALQGSSVPEHDNASDVNGGHGEMDIVP